MSALDLLRSVIEPDENKEHAHDSHRFQVEFDDLEPRQLLSAVQAATNTETTEPTNIGATGGFSPPAALVGQPGAGSSVVTHAVGDVDYLQSQLPVTDILSNEQLVTDDVYSTDLPLTVATGLTSLPITPLLSPSITSNETPLDNGTFDPGTVWITMPPETQGVFHVQLTESPQFASTLQQAVNPTNNVPTFTHFGQGATGGMSGVSTNEPVAVGPVGPSITEEISPVQPPPVEAHQPAGPPAMIQQDETAPQENAQTPPGGQQGSGAQGTPGQGAVPGQAGSGGQGATGATTEGVHEMTPQVPGNLGVPGGGGGQGQVGGAQAPGGGAQGGGGGGGSSGGSGGSGAFLLLPDHDRFDQEVDPADLVDEAIPALVAGADEQKDAGALPTVFGAAAVALGGYQMALRTPRRSGRNLAGAPPKGDG